MRSEMHVIAGSGMHPKCIQRKHWEEESGKRGDKFDVSVVVGTGFHSDHQMLFKRATTLYNTLFGNAREVACELFALSTCPQCARNRDR